MPAEAAPEITIESTSDRSRAIRHRRAELRRFVRGVVVASVSVCAIALGRVAVAHGSDDASAAAPRACVTREASVPATLVAWNDTLATQRDDDPGPAPLARRGHKRHHARRH
jgi:hypothetical protein